MRTNPTSVEHMPIFLTTSFLFWDVTSSFCVIDRLPADVLEKQSRQIIRHDSIGRVGFPKLCVHYFVAPRKT